MSRTWAVKKQQPADANRWRNGSASDSSPEGYEFNSRAVQPRCLVLLLIFMCHRPLLSLAKVQQVAQRSN